MTINGNMKLNYLFQKKNAFSQLVNINSAFLSDFGSTYYTRLIVKNLIHTNPIKILCSYLAGSFVLLLLFMSIIDYQLMSFQFHFFNVSVNTDILFIMNITFAIERDYYIMLEVPYMIFYTVSD